MIPAVFSANYEVSFPLLIDADTNPYNRIVQQGQTIVDEGGIGYNPYDTNLIDTKINTSYVPGVRSDLGYGQNISEAFICVEPLKDGKSMGKNIVATNPSVLGMPAG